MDYRPTDTLTASLLGEQATLTACTALYEVYRTLIDKTKTRNYENDIMRYCLFLLEGAEK